MRIVFVGACERVLHASKELTKQGHEIIIIDIDEEKLKKLPDDLDCGLICGDGSNPDLLQETKPSSVDYLFGFTKSDQTNILIGLVGKSLKFNKVVVVIQNLAYEKLCQELGLENVFVPSQKIGNAIVSFVLKGETTEVQEYIKDEGDLFKFVIDEHQELSVDALDLPSSAHAICYYRDGQFNFVESDTAFKEGDEVIVLIRKQDHEKLEKWASTRLQKK